MTLYRGYEIVPAQGGFAATDDHDKVIACGETEEKVMDAIDRWKREQRAKQTGE